jgi:hypothetical protein
MHLRGSVYQQTNILPCPCLFRLRAACGCLKQNRQVQPQVLITTLLLPSPHCPSSQHDRFPRAPSRNTMRNSQACRPVPKSKASAQIEAREQYACSAIPQLRCSALMHLTGMFSQEVKNALYRSHHLLKDKVGLWERKASPEADAFWQPYIANCIIQNRWDDVDLCDHVCRVAERLCRISHPQGLSQETAHKVSKQYVTAFCRQFMPLHALRRMTRYREKPLNEPLDLLRMALVNNCHEGARYALEDPVLNDMITHSEESDRDGLDDLALLAAQNGDTALLAKIFSNQNLGPVQSETVRKHAFKGAVTAARLDVVTFILEHSNDLPDYDPTCEWDIQDLVTGMLKSRSVDFSAQLFKLLEPHRDDCEDLESLFDYKNLLTLVVCASPQRVDVVEWLLKYAVSAEQPVDEEERYRFDADGNLQDLLERAVRSSNDQIVLLVLSYGVLQHAADARELGERVLKMAARRGRLDIVRILVKHDAYIPARVPSTRRDEVAMWRRNKLMRSAALIESEELCRYLMEHGAILNDAAMEAAVWAQLVSMVRLLLDFGADVKEWMIEQAKEQGNSEVVTLLEARYDNGFVNRDLEAPTRR